MFIELIRSCNCGDIRLAIDRSPGPCFSIFPDTNEIYIVTIPHTELCGQYFSLNCPKCHECTFALLKARSKPMHPIISATMFSVEYLHIYRKTWHNTKRYQYLATLFIDELPKAFPPHIHECIFSDDNRPAIYVLSETHAPYNKDGKRT